MKQLVFEILGHYNQSIVRNIAANSLKSLSVIKVSFHTKTFKCLKPEIETLCQCFFREPLKRSTKDSDPFFPMLTSNSSFAAQNISHHKKQKRGKNRQNFLLRNNFWQIKKRSRKY